MRRGNLCLGPHDHTQSILKLLQDINKELGITIVVITHEMAVIRQICTPRGYSGRWGHSGRRQRGRGVHAHEIRCGTAAVWHRVPPESEEVHLESGTPPVRLVFDGEQISEPVVANLILKLAYR